jgi:CheY-like chemotaxis protein
VTESGGGGNEASRRRSILLVDDDQDARTIFATLFEAMGFEVLHAGDGLAAVQVVRDRHPDLVLLNLFLPRMSGYQVLRTLRAEQASAAIPCLLFTGDARYEQMGRALIHGADGFVTKPAKPRTVLHMVRSLLGESTGESPQD